MSADVVVDGANVVGSRPDGWWRDRAGAATRLGARLVAALEVGGLDGPVHLVLEGAARAADPPPHPRLQVVRAPADGDTAIVDVVRALGGAGVLVVTADRALRARVEALGASTTGPSTLLATLPDP